MVRSCLCSIAEFPFSYVRAIDDVLVSVIDRKAFLVFVIETDGALEPMIVRKVIALELVIKRNKLLINFAVIDIVVVCFLVLVFVKTLRKKKKREREKGML
jgi:hypothetical protein